MPNNLHPKKGIKETRKAGSSNVFRRVYERFVKIRGRPREIALGFALGIFTGIILLERRETCSQIFKK